MRLQLLLQQLIWRHQFALLLLSLLLTVQLEAAAESGWLALPSLSE